MLNNNKLIFLLISAALLILLTTLVAYCIYRKRNYNLHTLTKVQTLKAPVDSSQKSKRQMISSPREEPVSSPF